MTYILSSLKDMIHRLREVESLTQGHSDQRVAFDLRFLRVSSLAVLYRVCLPG